MHVSRYVCLTAALFLSATAIQFPRIRPGTVLVTKPAPHVEPGSLSPVGSAGAPGGGTALYSANPLVAEAGESTDARLVKCLLGMTGRQVGEALLEQYTSALLDPTPATAALSVATSPATDAGVVPPNSLPGAYDGARDPRLPSIDVANLLSQRGDLQQWRSLFTPAEYNMYQSNPLCFYANLESRYMSARANPVAPANLNVRAAVVTSAPSGRFPIQRQSQADARCAAVSAGQVAASVVVSGTLGACAQSVSQLYSSVLPDHLWSIHLATPSLSGQVAVMAVSATSCPGLDGGAGPSTSYRVLEVSSGGPGPMVAGKGSGGTASDGVVVSKGFVLLATGVLVTLLFVCAS